jgi:hypothetical protein
MDSKRVTRFDFDAIGLGPPLSTSTEHTPPQRKRVRIGPVSTEDSHTGLRKLRLVESIQSNKKSHYYLSPINGSPWEYYHSEYQLRLGKEDLITVAARQDLSHHPTEKKYAMSELVLIKMFSGPGADDKLRMLQQIRHDNIVAPLQIFKSEAASLVVFEYMAFPLSSVAASPQLTNIRLAAILGQVRFRKCKYMTVN